MGRGDETDAGTEVDVGDEHGEEHHRGDHHEERDPAAGAAGAVATQLAQGGHQLLSSVALELSLLLTLVVSLSA